MGWVEFLCGGSAPRNATQYTSQNGTTVPLVNITAMQNNPANESNVAVRSAIISKSRAEFLFHRTLHNTPDRTEQLSRLSTFRPCSRKIHPPKATWQFTLRSTIISKNRAEVLFRLTLHNTPDRTEQLFRLSIYCAYRERIYNTSRTENESMIFRGRVVIS